MSTGKGSYQGCVLAQDHRQMRQAGVAEVTFERGVKLESSPSAGTTSSIDDPMQASTWCSLVGVPPAREFFWRQIQAG